MLKALQAGLVLQDGLDHKAFKARKECRDRRVPKAAKGMVRKDHKESKARREPPVRKGPDRRGASSQGLPPAAR